MSRPSSVWWRERLGPVVALAACRATGWAGTCAMVSVVLLMVIYRLAAERERRKALLDIYLIAPAGTEVVHDAGPGGPSLRVRVGGGVRKHSPDLVMARPVAHPGRARRRRS